MEGGGMFGETLRMRFDGVKGGWDDCNFFFHIGSAKTSPGDFRPGIVAQSSQYSNPEKKVIE
jgi:hypothetical protein